MSFERNEFDTAAEYYDLFERKSATIYERITALLDRLFQEHDVRRVLDMSCGTGAQSIPLAQKGYEVTACDISARMLGVARERASRLPIRFHHGDMRASQFGSFDAVIAMFNSVGYLSRGDFVAAIENAASNLGPSGLFVFDTTNLDYLRAGNFSPDRFIDSAGEHEGTKYVRFTQSEFDRERGVMAIHWEAHVQRGFSKPKTFAGTWTRRTYSAAELKELVESHGFEILSMEDRDGGAFSETRSFSMVTVARRS